MDQQLCNPALPPALGGCGQAQTQGPVAIGSLLGGIIGVVMILGMFLMLAFLLTGSIMWITSNGEKSQLEAARNKITNAIIGMVILAAVYAIFTLVAQFIGINTGEGPGSIIFPTLDLK